MDPTLLSPYLARQRWYAGKSRAGQITDVQTVGLLQTGPPAVRIDLVTVDYPGGEVETYQLALAAYPQPVDHLAHAFVCEERAGHTRVWLYDALHDKDVTGAWLREIAAASSAESRSESESESDEPITFHRAPGDLEVPVDAPSIVIGAEQSNTSLIFDDLAIMKVFRKVSAGCNPDIEVHDALARVGSPHIAAPLGWVGGRWRDPASGETVTGSLAMVQVFLRNSTEGWEFAKTSVRDLFGEADLHADEVGGDFAGESYRLGAVTAEVHAALAEALPADTIGPAQLRSLVDAMHARLDRAAAEVDALAPYVDRLHSTYDAVAAIPDPVPVQRIHGDFHLGQTMRTLEGWKLLDFEGEPAKPLEERRALASPLQDVAGMLRSFDYAAQHLLADHGHEPQLEYRALEWSERNRNAFCEGYGKSAGDDPRDSGPLLLAFETDKAVYEVVYEARNRPSWLRIPMSAIERLAATG